MSIQFVIGEAGVGKSTSAYEYILKDCEENPGRQHFLIVPEQATLQTQKALCNTHPGKSVMDVDILSFERLAFRVFHELGTDTHKVLEETGKSLIIRKLLEENRESFHIMGRNLGKPGYVENIKSMISELSQYRVGPEGLSALMEDGEPGLFFDKLSDMCLIYKAFMDHISGEYVTAEMLLDLLITCVDDSKLLRDSVIVFDRFTGFTPIQNAIIKRLMPITDRLVFTVTLNPREALFTFVNEEELFYMSKVMIRSLRAMAGEEGIKEEPSVLIERNPDNAISRHDITISRQSSPIAELHYAAATIKSLLMQGGRMRQMALVSADMNIYEPYVQDVFKSYDIDVFVDKSHSAGGHPLTGFLEAAFNLVLYDFRPRDLMAVLRSGFISTDRYIVDQLENYLLVTGIRGKGAFLKDFYLIPEGFSEESLDLINKLRAELMSLLYPLNMLIKDAKKCREHLSYFYDFTEKIGLYPQLKDRGEEDVYSLLLGVMDKTDTLVGTDIMEGEEFFSIIIAALEGTKLGRLPKSADMVVFGDLTRTRLDEIDALFILGANDGILPKTESGSGYFTERDRRLLEDKGVKLAPMKRERQFAGMFYIYLVMSKARKHLYISYADTDVAGEALEPSYIIGNIKRDHPGAQEVHGELMPTTFRGGFNRLSVLLGNYLRRGGLNARDELELRLLYTCFKEHDPQGLTELIENLSQRREPDALDREILAAINGDSLNVSVSRLETYARCAYSYYLKYILGLKKRRVRELSSLDMGNIYHEGIYNFFTMAKEEGVDYKSLIKAESDALLGRAVDRVYEELIKGADYDTGLDSYIRRRVEMTLERTVWTLVNQVKAGSFEPSYFEVELKEVSDPDDLKREIEGGHRMQVSGKIDRMDLMRDGDRVYLKIIDYKSGNNKIDYSLIRGGLQIQLLFYMDAALKGMEKAEEGVSATPSAVLYYHIDDPVVEGRQLDEARDILTRVERSLRPSGLVSSGEDSLMALDPEIIRARDERLENEARPKKERLSLSSYTSPAVKVEVTGKGAYNGRSSDMVDPLDINLLMDYTNKMAERLAYSMAEGNIQKYPFRLKDKKACDACDFKGLCGFEEETSEHGFRQLRKIDNLSDFKEVLGEEDGL